MCSADRLKNAHLESREILGRAATFREGKVVGCWSERKGTTIRARFRACALERALEWMMCWCCRRELAAMELFLLAREGGQFRVCVTHRPYFYVAANTPRRNERDTQRCVCVCVCGKRASALVCARARVCVFAANSLRGKKPVWVWALHRRLCGTRGTRRICARTCSGGSARKARALSRSRFVRAASLPSLARVISPPS